MLCEVVLDVKKANRKEFVNQSDLPLRREVQPEAGVEIRLSELGAEVRLGGVEHTREFWGLDQALVGLGPVGKSRSFFDPMCVGGFVAPGGQLLHGPGMWTGPTESFHHLFALPRRQRPESSPRVDQ